MRNAVAGGNGRVGRHVLSVAHERGHETVVLARSASIDLTNGTGVIDMLTGTGCYRAKLTDERAVKPGVASWKT